MYNIIEVGNIKGYISNDIVWLNAEDVARGFGFVQMKGNVTYVRWTTVNSYLSSFGFSQQVGKDDYIPENMVYRLGFKANNDVALKFQCLLADEVLPSIRKHGAYMSEQVIERTLSDPDYLIQLATTLKDERKARLEAEQRAAALTVENIEKQNKIEADKPKVTFADAIIGSRTSCLIGQLAKVLSQNGYKIGQNRLFKWLRDNHYLGSWGSYYNLPYQVYVEQGLFEVKYTTHSENERMVTSATTKVTGKGQQYFINLFINKQPILI